MIRQGIISDILKIAYAFFWENRWIEASMNEGVYSYLQQDIYLTRPHVSDWHIYPEQI